MDIASLRCDLQKPAPPSERTFIGDVTRAVSLNVGQAKAMLHVLAGAGLACKSLSLPATQRKVDYLRTQYTDPELIYITDSTLKDLEHLEIDFVQELCEIKFLRLDSVRMQYFVEGNAKAFPFESGVHVAFPSADADIREASNCFALERWPACVFHLMRVLEAGLAVLAFKFGVSSDRANWQNIIEQIEAEVRKIGPTSGPDWKQQQKDFSDAATQFMFFKDAWRNHVMHKRDVYDEGRARSIWQHTQEFMNKLVSIGLKE